MVGVLSVPSISATIAMVVSRNSLIQTGIYFLSCFACTFLVATLIVKRGHSTAVVRDDTKNETSRINLDDHWF